jgi:hypothetical protein
MLSATCQRRLLGNRHVWEKVLPQSHRAAAGVTPALNRQGGNVLVAAYSKLLDRTFLIG